MENAIERQNPPHAKLSQFGHSASFLLRQCVRRMIAVGKPREAWGPGSGSDCETTRGRFRS
jgi:hypothetical protein